MPSASSRSARTPTIRVGVHVSIAGSIALAVTRAAEAGCNTFQIFSRNPRGWGYRDLSIEDTAQFREALSNSGISPVFDHMPYLPNLATPREEIYEKSCAALTAELLRCGTLGIPFLVTHLGHHLGEGIGGGKTRVIRAVNLALGAAPNGVMLLLENTAGEKNGVGSTFEDIREVMDGIEFPERTGVCFDTCHAYGAGYDLRTPEGLGETLDRLDEVIGHAHVRLIHLNDSKGDLGSGLDRHEHIGLGSIGEEAFAHMLQLDFFRKRPLICETPVDGRRDDRGNIRKVWELAGAEGD
ncbi:MAG: endonuclease IV [Methanoregulaceae archaeon PtaB.Bin152]|nr:MAG: endonuclease IV [Methanoregulaceae archaeon PtaB.Bin152]